jgi:hypothetical protein
MKYEKKICKKHCVKLGFGCINFCVQSTLHLLIVYDVLANVINRCIKLTSEKLHFETQMSFVPSSQFDPKKKLLPSRCKWKSHICLHCFWIVCMNLIQRSLTKYWLQYLTSKFKDLFIVNNYAKRKITTIATRYEFETIILFCVNLTKKIMFLQS